MKEIIEKADWTKNEIDDRENRLIENAKKIWD